MKVKIFPGHASGNVVAPPSKSMAHRLLMGAGLADGVSHISHIDLSEDIKATLGILKALGCRYTYDEQTVTIEGIGNMPLFSDQALDCNESGSTLRFFIPLLLTGGKKCKFIGAKRLMERPLDVYEAICKEQGILFEQEGQSLVLEGKLQAAHFKVPGGISSQFITGLLYALPLLQEDSVLEILPPIESKAYIDMTLEALEHYGISIRKEENCYYVKGGQQYLARDGYVEGDYSNAAFLDALTVVGGTVEVAGLREDSLQGDKVYQTYFEQLEKGYATLDISECPDLGPILMGVAAAKHGAKLTGTKRLKIKESDRGTVMAQELEKFGIQTEVYENEIIIYPGELQVPTEELESYNDHRIAMTLATLCSITGGIICRAEAVRKSFPNYYKIIETLGIRLEEIV